MIGRPLCECARDAAVPGRSLVDRRTAAAGVLRNMRRHVHRTQLVDEVFCVDFVGIKLDRCRPVGMRLDHVQGRHPFGMPVGQCQAGINQQAVAVRHQPLPDEAQLCLFAFTVAVEPGTESEVEPWVSFERFWPWKLASALRPPP